MCRLGLSFVVLALLATRSASVGQADNQAPAIAALIEQLDDTEFARREAAADALASLGASAIDSLVRAAAEDSPEVTSRSIGLIERLMESDDVEAVDAADAALVKLQALDDPQASALAGAALDRKSAVREQRAITRITELGGQVEIGPQVDRHGNPLPGLTLEEAGLLKPRIILLGQDWKGGVEGLVHLRKLSNLSYLTLYVEQGSNVPLDSAQSLASVLPGLMVHHRGPFLGVKAVSDGECIIESVTRDGPAAKAGLQPGDLVVALENEPVRQFYDLVESLKNYKIGDTVAVQVQRHGQTLDLDVKLESWKLAPITESEPSIP